MAWLGPADLALQQAAWWSAVLLAAAGRPVAAAAPAALVVLIHLSWRSAERSRLLRAAAAAAAYGLVTDTLLSAAGLARFGEGGLVAPAWMCGLWAVFGVGLTASMRRVAGWPAPVLAALGAVGGPLAYRGGAALGAIALSDPLAFAAIALQWAVALPLLARVARRDPAPAAGLGAGSAGTPPVEVHP